MKTTVVIDDEDTRHAAIRNLVDRKVDFSVTGHRVTFDPEHLRINGAE